MTWKPADIVAICHQCRATSQAPITMGWPLVCLRGESVPCIEDITLGERLGYTTPRRDVQRVIDSLIADGQLQGIRCADISVTTSMPNGGTRTTTVKAYFPNEEEAIDIIMASLPMSRPRPADAPGCVWSVGVGHDLANPCNPSLSGAPCAQVRRI